MNPEFFFHRKDGRDKMHAFGMSFADMAIQPAYIARKIYASIMRQSPVHAEMFRKMVIEAVTSPLTWDISTMPSQDLEVMIPVPGDSKNPN